MHRWRNKGHVGREVENGGLIVEIWVSRNYILLYNSNTLSCFVYFK